MKIRHHKLLILLLLPLMLARGLLGSGLMLSVDTGTPQVVMCPADGPVLMGMSMHAHHHHAGAGGVTTAGHDNGACPFAIAAGAALQPTISSFSLGDATALALAPAHEATFESAPSPRSHPIRGPPQVS